MLSGLGDWLDAFEGAAMRKHGFGWDDTGPDYRDADQQDLFQPMCAGCDRRSALTITSQMAAA